MGSTVQISKGSLELINQYLEACNQYPVRLGAQETAIELNLLVSWLTSDEIALPANTPKKSEKEIEFLLALIRAELLHDLLVSMPVRSKTRRKIDIQNEKQSPSTSDRLKLGLLAVAGTLLAACEGFDSISTMLGVLSIPSWAILLAGLAFSILSVVVFYGFDLVQVSKNLGVSLRDAPKLLDVYLSQLNEIKSIRRKINTYSLTDLSPEELNKLVSTVLMLQIRFKRLTESSQQFYLALNTNSMHSAKFIFSAAAGLLFLGGGFFAGQSVAIFMLGFFFAAVTPTFWPVILFSVVVGAASFSLYWYVQRVGLTKLISGWFGLDEDKIELLCDQDKLTKEEDKLNNLMEKVNSAHGYKTELSRRDHKPNGTEVETRVELLGTSQRKQVDKLPISPLYSFFRKPFVGGNPPHGAARLDTSYSYS